MSRECDIMQMMQKLVITRTLFLLYISSSKGTVGYNVQLDHFDEQNFNGIEVLDELKSKLQDSGEKQK